MRKGLALSASIIVMVLAFVRPTHSLYWSTWTVDASGDVGRFSSIALDTLGPRIAYCSTSPPGIKCARAVPAGVQGCPYMLCWLDANVEWIVSGKEAHHTSLALQRYTYKPQVSYFAHAPRGSDSLFVGVRETSGWQLSLADVGSGGLGAWTSIQRDASDDFNISYEYMGDLRRAYKSGLSWNHTTLDSLGTRGLCSSLSFYGSLPRIAYYGDSKLRYAAWNGSSWVMDSVQDISSSNYGLYASLALDPWGNPSVTYYDAANGYLKYARKSGASWIVQTVDSGGCGLYTSLALGSDQRPHISYYDATHGWLKYAVRSGGGWQVEIADSGIAPGGSDTARVGLYTSLALDAGNNAYISYYDSTHGDLKCARSNCDFDVEFEPGIIASHLGTLAGTGKEKRAFISFTYAAPGPNDLKVNLHRADTGDSVCACVVSSPPKEFDGRYYYLIDFTNCPLPTAYTGEYYLKSGNGKRSWNFQVSDSIYNGIAYNTASVFFPEQMCGKQIGQDTTSLHYWHKACHRADTFLLVAGTTYRDTVGGGFHDANDWDKYEFARSWTSRWAGLLCHSLLDFSCYDSLHLDFDKMGYHVGDTLRFNEHDDVADLKQVARWGLLLGLRMLNMRGDTLSVPSHSRVWSNNSFAPGDTLPGEDSTRRIYENDSPHEYFLWDTDLECGIGGAAHFAAAAAAGYCLFKDTDPHFADSLLIRAKAAYDFVSDSITSASVPPASRQVFGRLKLEAEVELLCATLDPQYLTAARNTRRTPGFAFDWSCHYDGTARALAMLHNYSGASSALRDSIEDTLAVKLQQLEAEEDSDPFGVSARWELQSDVQPDVNGRLLAIAEDRYWISTIYDLPGTSHTDPVKAAAIRDRGRRYLDWVLGLSPGCDLNYSYVTGIGERWPVKPLNAVSTYWDEKKRRLIGGIPGGLVQGIVWHLESGFIYNDARHWGPNEYWDPLAADFIFCAGIYDKSQGGSEAQSSPQGSVMLANIAAVDIGETTAVLSYVAEPGGAVFGNSGPDPNRRYNFGAKAMQDSIRHPVGPGESGGLTPNSVIYYEVGVSNDTIGTAKSMMRRFRTTGPGDQTATYTPSDIWVEEGFLDSGQSLDLGLHDGRTIKVERENYQLLKRVQQRAPGRGHGPSTLGGEPPQNPSSVEPPTPYVDVRFPVSIAEDTSEITSLGIQIALAASMPLADTLLLYDYSDTSSSSNHWDAIAVLHLPGDSLFAAASIPDPTRYVDNSAQSVLVGIKSQSSSAQFETYFDMLKVTVTRGSRNRDSQETGGISDSELR